MVSYFLSDLQQVEETYKLGKSEFEDQRLIGNLYINLARLEKKDFVSPDQIVYSSPVYDLAKEYIDSSEEGLTELKRIYYKIEYQNSAYFSEISTWAAYFGNTEFAMEAMEKAISIDATMLYLVSYNERSPATSTIQRICQRNRLSRLLERIRLA